MFFPCRRGEWDGTGRTTGSEVCRSQYTRVFCEFTRLHTNRQPDDQVHRSAKLANYFENVVPWSVHQFLIRLTSCLQWTMSRSVLMSIKDQKDRITRRVHDKILSGSLFYLRADTKILFDLSWKARLVLRTTIFVWFSKDAAKFFSKRVALFVILLKTQFERKKKFAYLIFSTSYIENTVAAIKHDIVKLAC